MDIAPYAKAIELALYVAGGGLLVYVLSRGVKWIKADQKVEDLQDDQEAVDQYEENRRDTRTGLRKLTQRWLRDLRDAKGK